MAAGFSETIAVTETGCEILTVSTTPDGGER
jgi:hypothetical protein